MTEEEKKEIRWNELIKDHVFLDASARPYLVHKWDKEWWLFYWHPENHWTSLRQVAFGDTFPNNLTQEEQEVYHTLHRKWEGALFSGRSKP